MSFGVCVCECVCERERSLGRASAKEYREGARPCGDVDRKASPRKLHLVPAKGLRLVRRAEAADHAFELQKFANAAVVCFFWGGGREGCGGERVRGKEGGRACEMRRLPVRAKTVPFRQATLRTRLPTIAFEMGVASSATGGRFLKCQNASSPFSVRTGAGVGSV